MERRHTTLPSQVPQLRYREPAIFHWSGAITGIRGPDGRWPITSDGQVAEVALAITYPSDVDQTAYLLYYLESDPVNLRPLGSFVLPAGQYQALFDVNYVVHRGQALASALVPDGTPVSPGYGMMMLAHIL